MKFTNFLHFNDEGINVVTGIVAVQVFLVSLHLLTDKVYKGFEIAENFVVRTRQVLHYSR